MREKREDWLDGGSCGEPVGEHGEAGAGVGVIPPDLCKGHWGGASHRGERSACDTADEVAFARSPIGVEAIGWDSVHRPTADGLAGEARCGVERC